MRSGIALHLNLTLFEEDAKEKLYSNSSKTLLYLICDCMLRQEYDVSKHK